MSDNGHEPFDLDGDGETIALFPESDAEKEVREAFYNTTPARADDDFDVYRHSISIKRLPWPQGEAEQLRGRLGHDRRRGRQRDRGRHG